MTDVATARTCAASAFLPMAVSGRETAPESAKMRLPRMIFSIRDSLVRARGSLAPLGVALVFSMGCELVLGDIPDNTSSSSATGGDAGSPGGSSSTSSGGSTGTTGTGGCCDCDGDGHRSTACNGDDCDDNNAAVHPGQMDFFDKATSSNSFDYDCSMKIEFEYPSVNCAVPIGVLCDTTTFGFLGDGQPPCGMTGDLGHCISGVSCTKHVEQAGAPVRCH